MPYTSRRFPHGLSTDDAVLTEINWLLALEGASSETQNAIVEIVTDLLDKPCAPCQQRKAAAAHKDMEDWIRRGCKN